MFMYQEIYNQLEGIQKVIFVFWNVCVVLFCYFYVRGIISIIQHKFFNTQKS